MAKILPPSRVGAGSKEVGQVHATDLSNVEETPDTPVRGGFSFEDNDTGEKRGEEGTNPQVGYYRDRDLPFRPAPTMKCKKRTLIWSLQINGAIDESSAMSTDDLYVWVNTIAYGLMWYNQYLHTEVKQGSKPNPFGKLALAFLSRQLHYLPFIDGMMMKWVRHYMYHAASDERGKYQIRDSQGNLEGGYVKLLKTSERAYSYYLTDKGRDVRVETKPGGKMRSKR